MSNRAQDVYEIPPDYEASIHDGDDSKTAGYLQHACVKRFSVGVHGSRFLGHWTENRSADLAVLSIDIRLTDEPDYEHLDPIVNCIKPRAMEVVRQRRGSGNSHDAERLQMLSRDAFLSSLQTVRVVVWFDDFPPASFVLDEPGYAHYEFKCCYGRRAPDAVDALLEHFLNKGCANEKLESLCLRWDDIDDQQSLNPNLLVKRTPMNEPLPGSEMVLKGVPEGYLIMTSEFSSIDSQKQPKRMEVYKWVIEYDNGRSQNRAHVLQCRVKTT